MSSSETGTASRRNVHVMTKPIGPICNLDCSYCFYLDKEDDYDQGHDFRMRPEVLEEYIRQYIANHEGNEIPFAWQGGEPTLLGIDFFRRVVELQAYYCPAGKTVSNAIQTNATLLDKDWCRFLAEHDFLVGISIDGPKDLHDHYRVDKGGKPSWSKVMRGVELCRRHGVAFNTLTVVNRVNSREPLRVYEFLRSIGAQHMQFIPLVERFEGAPDEAARRKYAHHLAGPPDLASEAAQVTDWSVLPSDFGNFLCSIFDRWIERDVGRIFVQIFDVMLGIWHTGRSSLCVFSRECGSALAMEHDGALYACDHYVYDQYHLGNIMDRDIGLLAGSEQQRAFGQDKDRGLPDYCRRCDVRFACNGECPKHRFALTPDGEEGLNYLCRGYQQFLRHIDYAMRTMSRLIADGQPPARIMDLLAASRSRAAATAPQQKVGRNEPCPCGSGKKYKHCHGA